MADSIVICVQTGEGEQLPVTIQFTVYLLRPADRCNWIIWSSQYVKKQWIKLCEALLVAFMTATAGATSIYFLDDYCHGHTEDTIKFAVKVFCPDNHYNELSSFWFQRAEDTLRSLFHDPKGSYNVVPLIVFFVLYFMMSVVTTGLSVSAGVFVPALLSGAAWGRLIGIGIQNCFPDSNLEDIYYLWMKDKLTTIGCDAKNRQNNSWCQRRRDQNR
ncbi:hypothetical protein J6590_017134 [Homalodisca vitripennis]|nr:hypothetical protein J6590_017134 [Homalodisca vitripennis]